MNFILGPWGQRQVVGVIAFLFLVSTNTNAFETRNFNVTARTFALAGTTDLVSADGENLNPASLAFAQEITLSATKTQALADTQAMRFHLSGTKSPLAYSFGYFLYDYGSIEAVDETGAREGLAQPKDELLSLNFANSFGQENLAWGLRISHAKRTLDTKANGFLFDLGLVQQNWLEQGMHFGISYLLVGQRMSWGASSEKQNPQLSLQTAYHRAWGRFFLSSVREKSKWHYLLAAEIPWQMMSLRVGRVGSNFIESRSRYRWGFGLILGNLKFDWGYSVMNALSNINIASVSYLF